MSALTIVNAEVDGHASSTVHVRDGCIRTVEHGQASSPAGDVIDANGGAVLPGLHDHHLHLFALAAADASVRCGPPDVATRDDLRAALTAACGEWVRGIGYHESVAGDLDRHALDALVSDRPVRVQHRSGMLWIVNSAAADRLGLDTTDAPGIERDSSGRATGRLFRLDHWIRARLGPRPIPSLRALGRRFAHFGVTSVTDATVGNGPDELRAFVEASTSGDLPQRLVVMGGRTLPHPESVRVARGPVKIVLDELDEPPLPALDALRDTIAGAHADDRAVAIHCVTRTTVVLAASALADAGARPGDRLEHASVAPPDALDLVRALPVTVVTQPTFVRERGDVYLRDVPEGERPWLYRGRGFLDAGVPLAAGSDAPFGDLNPWTAMQAAVDRRTRGGRVLAEEEGVTPEEAFALFASPLGIPADVARRLAVDAPADMIVLDRPWAEARRRLADVAVQATLCDGRLIE